MSAVLKAVPPRRRKTLYQTVDVEFDIGDFDDEDLIAELQERGIEVHGGVSADDLYNAMARRDYQRALELLRTFLMDYTGRVLP